MPGDDLDAIKAEALAEQPQQPANDAGAPGQQQPQQQLTQEQRDELEAREWAEIPATFGSIVTMPMPELEKVYTDEACMEWGRAMVPIARRYGWNAGSGMAWLRLLGCTFMLVKPTVQAIAARRKASAAAATTPNPTKPAAEPATAAADRPGMVKFD